MGGDCVQEEGQGGMYYCASIKISPDSDLCELPSLKIFISICSMTFHRLKLNIFSVV